MLSVGDHPIGLKAIPLLRKSLPPHELVIWNNGSSKEHAENLRSLCDVFMNSSHNMWTSKGFGYALLYLEYEWLIISAPDIVVRDDWWKFVEPHMKRPEVGIIGDCMKPDRELGSWELSNPDSLPDGITLWRKEMINDVGGISPSFGIWGHDLLDLQIRAWNAGWKIVNIHTGLIHTGDGHTGVDAVKKELGEKRFDEMHSRSCRALKSIRKNWWVLTTP